MTSPLLGIVVTILVLHPLCCRGETLYRLWPLTNETHGNEVRSASGSPAQLTGGHFVAGNPGLGNTAYSLNSTTSVVIPAHDLHVLLDEFTLSALFHIDPIKSSSIFRLQDPQTLKIFRVYIENEQLCFKMSTKEKSCSSNIYKWKGWYNIGIYRNKDAKRFIVYMIRDSDCFVKFETNDLIGSDESLPANGILQIGAVADGNSNFPTHLDGSVSCVRLYRGDLTTSSGVFSMRDCEFQPSWNVTPHATPQGNTVTANKKLFTFYTTEASWNTANHVCQANGGRLAKITSADINSFLKYHINQDESDYWIGLHNGSASVDNFRWAGLCETLDHQGYNNWECQEAEHLSSDRCGKIDKNDGEWSTLACSEKQPFICEYWKGMCTFEKTAGSSLSTNDFVTVNNSATTAEMCKEQCRISERVGRKECWAVSVNSRTPSMDDSKRCTLYYMSFNLYPTLKQDDDLDLYIKMCYEATIEPTAISSGSNYKEPDSPDEPVNTCYNYTDPLEEDPVTTANMQTSEDHLPSCTTQRKSSTSMFPTEPLPTSPFSDQPLSTWSITLSSEQPLSTFASAEQSLVSTSVSPEQSLMSNSVSPEQSILYSSSPYQTWPTSVAYERAMSTDQFSGQPLSIFTSPDQSLLTFESLEQPMRTLLSIEESTPSSLQPLSTFASLEPPALTSTPLRLQTSITSAPEQLEQPTSSFLIQRISTSPLPVWQLLTSSVSTPPLPDDPMSSIVSTPPDISSSVNVYVVNTSPPNSVVEDLSCCSCPDKIKLSKEESSAFISSILHDMDDVKENVLANKRERRRISVYEDRPVAKGIGCSGVIILAIVFGGIFVMDLPRLNRDIRMIVHRVTGQSPEEM